MIGDKLKQRRMALKLTQQQLADMIGAKKNTISNYECGISSPNEDVIIALMAALQCDANYLFDYSEPVQCDSLPLMTGEKQMLDYFRGFNKEGQDKLLDISFDMSQLDRYKTKAIYRAADSKDHTEHEIIEDGGDIIKKLSKASPVTKKEDF